MHKPLRLGILSDSTSIPGYIFDALAGLQKEDEIVIPAVFRNLSPQSSSLKEKLPKLGRVTAEKLFGVLSRTDSHMEMRDVSALSSNTEIIDIRPLETKFSHRFSEEDIKIVDGHNCDFLLRCGFKILRGEILSTAKYGVLSFHHGDNKINRGGPALYWEFAEGWETAGVILQILSEELDGGVVLDRAFPNLIPWDYWASKNNLGQASSSMLFRYLSQFDESSSQGEANSFFDGMYDGKLYRSATNPVGFAHAAKFLGRYSKKAVDKILYENQWSLFVGDRHKSPRRYRELLPGEGEFWADPFLYANTIFVERYDYSTALGRIGYVQLDKELNVVEQGDVDIGEDIHLSFPNVFEHDGEIYMLPETSASQHVSLYRCESFPNKFQHAQTLLEGVFAVDSIVFQFEGLWWIFTTHASLSGRCNIELQLYYSENLLTDSWTLHPQSPLCIDVRRGRNGGQIQRVDGKLYRFAQDGSIRYGRRLGVYEIVALTPTHYEEVFIRYIEPKWSPGLNRCHTYNVHGSLAVLDGSRDVLKARI